VVAPSPSSTSSRKRATFKGSSSSSSATSIKIGKKSSEQLRAAAKGGQSSIDQWNAVLQEAERSSDPKFFRDTFSRFLKKFPTAARYWKVYIEKEMRAHNFDRCSELFTQCLHGNPDVQLWEAYLAYVHITQRGKENEQQVIHEAFEYTLEHVGMAYDSGPVWENYLKYIQSVKVEGQYEEGQKTTLLRQVFQRAVVTPMDKVEQIWREYDIFEHKLSKDLAKNIMREMQPKFASAKTCARERKKLFQNIFLASSGFLARPPIKPTEERDLNQALLWRGIIDSELQNLQRLDDQSLYKRVRFAYRQALLTLRCFPDMWMDAAMYCADAGHKDEAESLLCEGARALAGCHGGDDVCLLIHLAYVNFLEKNGKLEKAKQVFELLLANKPYVLDGAGSGDSKASSGASKASTESSGDGKNEESCILSDAVLPLAYVNYMYFMRRVEGVDSSREVFTRFRQTNLSSYTMYLSAADIELSLNKQPKLAGTILRVGFQLFSTDYHFVVEYLRFLELMSDHENQRVLYEYVLQSDIVPKQDLESLWSRYLEFESRVGTEESVTRVEAKLHESIKDLDLDRPRSHSIAQMHDLVQRYAFFDAYPCSAVYRSYLAKLKRNYGSTVFRGGGSRDRLRGASSQNVTQLIDAATQRKMQQARMKFPRPDMSKLVKYERGMDVSAALAKAVPVVIQNLIKYVSRVCVFVSSCFLFLSHPISHCLPLTCYSLTCGRILPRPAFYAGSYVNVDKLMEQLAGVELPELTEEEQAEDAGMVVASAGGVAKPKTANEAGPPKKDMFRARRAMQMLL
jgi:cleavage stimulation factor subunit 3